MGGIIGKIGLIIGSRLERSAKAYNIISRVEKVLSKEKPTPAPSYPSTARQIEIAKQVDPNFMETHYKQDPELHDRLKQIFVTSNAQFVDEYQKSDKSLPQNKRGSREWDYGFWEPDKAREGRVLLKDALKFMADNMTDPESINSGTIAKQYKLDPKDVENILEYYRVFEIILPSKDPNQMVIEPPSIREFLGEKSNEKVMKK